VSAPVLAQPAAGAAANKPAGAQAERFVFRNYGAPVPGNWQPQPPASSFRAAQYIVPAASGAGEGEAVVFYFGKGQGGSVAANTERWVSQFSTADGKPVKPKIETLSVNGLPATLIELNGSYARGVGMGPAGAPKANQTLLTAVIESPDGNFTIQLHGDKATVERHRKGFNAMVRGFNAN
jgi:hypothetical protein